MKKIFFLSSFIFCFLLQLSAQDSLIIQIDSVKPINQQRNLFNYTSTSINNIFNEEIREGASNRFTVDFDYSGNSNAVPQGLAFAMIFKTPISKALKDRVDNRIKSQLRFEDFMKTGITYQHYIKKWDGTFFVTYQHRQMRNIVGSKQTFELLFYGNARFEGDTADLSNLRFQNFIYNQYGGGVKKKIDYGTYQMQFGMGFYFLQVMNHQDISTNKSWIYTATDGEYIDFNYDLTFNNAREGATKFGQLNGAGASGDFNIGFMNKNKWKLTLDVQDIGALTFRRFPVNYTAAKFVRFQGIVIPDLTSFSSQTFDTLNLDSTMRANLPTKSNNQYSVVLPFSATLIFSKPFLHDKLVLSAGLQYRHMPNYYAYGFVKANYFLKRDMIISASAGAGAYSLFNLGFEFAKSWKYFDLAIGSSNLIGLAAPSHYTGTSLYLRLASSF